MTPFFECFLERVPTVITEVYLFKRPVMKSILNLHPMEWKF